MRTYYASSKTIISGLTINCIKLIKFLLTRVNYVLIMEHQSDRIEGEFGIYRQLSERNYHNSIQLVLNSLTFQRLRLFNVLNLEESSAHQVDFCVKNLEEHEIVALNTCVFRIIMVR